MRVAEERSAAYVMDFVVACLQDLKAFEVGQRRISDGLQTIVGHVQVFQMIITSSVCVRSFEFGKHWHVILLQVQLTEEAIFHQEDLLIARFEVRFRYRDLFQSEKWHWHFVTLLIQLSNSNFQIWQVIRIWRYFCSMKLNRTIKARIISEQEDIYFSALHSTDHHSSTAPTAALTM